MAQPTPTPTPPAANGVSSPEPSDHSQMVLPGKRKRDDAGDEGAVDQHQEATPAPNPWATKNSQELLKYYHEVLTR